MSTVSANLPSPFEQPLGATPKRVTPDEFLQFMETAPGEYELVDGQLVEKPLSDISDLVAQNFNDELVLWSKPRNAGRSFVESNFRCFPRDPDQIRRPDVAFISAARIASYRWGQSTLTIVPDLVAEVLSPNETAFEIDNKLRDYLGAGVRRVLVLNSNLRVIRVHRALGAMYEIAGDETELTDEEVLPGFRCPLAKLFTRPGDVLPAAPAPRG
jgi:Uma2 family endonuclease